MWSSWWPFNVKNTLLFVWCGQDPINPILLLKLVLYALIRYLVLGVMAYLVKDSAMQSWLFGSTWHFFDTNIKLYWTMWSKLNHRMDTLLGIIYYSTHRPNEKKLINKSCMVTDSLNYLGSKGFVIVASIQLAVKATASLLDRNHMVFQFFVVRYSLQTFLYIKYGHEDEKKVYEPSSFWTNTKTNKVLVHCFLSTWLYHLSW